MLIQMYARVTQARAQLAHSQDYTTDTTDNANTHVE
jgi:hypothetical protein